MSDEQRVAGGIASSCFACGAGGRYSEEASDKRCHQCGLVTSYRRCLRCKKVLVFAPYLTRPEVKTWKCLSCGKEAARDRWPSATLGDFPGMLEFVALYGRRLTEVESDPERRIIDGSLLSAEGISGMATGSCAVFFDRTSAILLIGGFNNEKRIDYADFTGLQIGGRGKLVTSSGGGWIGGGFGLEGIVQGVALASVLNKLTTTQECSIETIVNVSWKMGSVKILNQHYLPSEVAQWLSPVMKRIEACRLDSLKLVTSTASVDYKTCPDCAEDVKAAARKCRFCGYKFDQASD